MEYKSKHKFTDKWIGQCQRCGATIEAVDSEVEIIWSETEKWGTELFAQIVRCPCCGYDEFKTSLKQKEIKNVS